MLQSDLIIRKFFTETVKINTLDYALYRDMQQKIIDVLDTADRVHIVGTNGNRTDLYVKIHELKEPSRRRLLKTVWLM